MAVKRSENFSIKRVRNNLGKFVRVVESKPYQILLEEAARIEAEAKFETPIGDGKRHRAGQLRDSVRVEVIGKLNPSLTASASAISETGYDYAGIQHDTEWFNHPRGGKYHFIEDPFNRGVERISQRLREEVSYD